MSRKWIGLIVAAVALLVGVALVGLRNSPPTAPDSSGGPSFVVNVVKPLSARPLFGFFGLLPPDDIGINHTSAGARAGRVGNDRLELVADGWELSIEIDGDGKVAPETYLVFPLHLANNDRTLRCRPEVPGIGRLRARAESDSGSFSGDFRIKLATCENVESGRVINWPPAPLTVVGSFDRLRPATGEES